MQLQEQSKKRTVSPQFERFVLFLAATFTCYRLVFALFSPTAWHIPDELLLTVLLVMVVYLWLAETQAISGLFRSEMALRDTQTAVLATLVQTVEAKDQYTRGHSEQVKRLSIELAKKMGLNKERVDLVARSAILHDVGKIEIPDAILNNKEPLTEKEWQIIKKHPTRMATILSPLDFLHQETHVALFHHERYDGTGYGVGLKGADIPIESSIIAVADMFDAMNSDRPYRPKLSKETVLQELKKSQGTQHAPAIVTSFLEMLEEQPELWLRS